MAQSAAFAPQEGVAYTIYCAGTNGHYVYYDSSDERVPDKAERGGAECYFTFTDAGDGSYYISPVTDNTRYMCYTSTNNGIESLGWSATSGGNDTKWVITASTVNEGEFTVSPYDKQDTYLNCFNGASSTHMGFYDGAADVNSQFAIQPVLSYDAASPVTTVEALADGDYVLNIHNCSGQTSADATGLIYYHDEGNNNQRRYRAIYNFAFEDGLVTDNRYVWTLKWNEEHTAFTLQNKALPDIYFSYNLHNGGNQGRGDMISGDEHALFEPIAVDGTNYFFLKLQEHVTTEGNDPAGLTIFLFTNNADNGFKNLSYWSIAEGSTTPDVSSGGVQMEFFSVAGTQASDIEVTVDYDADYAAAVVANLAKTGVGYPVADASVRAPLTEALAAYNEGATSGTVSIDTNQALAEAYNDYLLSSNVQMPEDGKAYTLTFVGNDTYAHEYYLNYDAENDQIVAVSRTEDTVLPQSAYFVARHIDGARYMFALPSGKYFVWKGNSSGVNSNKGVIDAYDEDYAALTLEHSRSNNGSQMASALAEDIFGTFTAWGHRENIDGDPGYFLLNSDGTFNRAREPYYTNSITSCFRIEEAPAYLNTVTMNTAGDYAYSTAYLPFAVDVPEGVEAFTGAVDGEELALTSIEDGVIPARTAVVLRGTTAGSLALAPSTAAGTAAADNALQGTLEADQSTPENTYVLSAFDGEAGFYKYTAATLPVGKAYLTLPAGTNVQKLSFSFGGQTTGIQGVQPAGEEKAATWYDLSGRRVTQPTKGIYIVNGKKVVLK